MSDVRIIGISINRSDLSSLIEEEVGLPGKSWEDFVLLSFIDWWVIELHPCSSTFTELSLTVCSIVSWSERSRVYHGSIKIILSLSWQFILIWRANLKHQGNFHINTTFIVLLTSFNTDHQVFIEWVDVLSFSVPTRSTIWALPVIDTIRLVKLFQAISQSHRLVVIFRNGDVVNEKFLKKNMLMHFITGVAGPVPAGEKVINNWVEFGKHSLLIVCEELTIWHGLSFNRRNICNTWRYGIVQLVL